MHLTGEIAQRIVDLTMAIVHRNVNLIDPTGEIIGSGHPRRIGTRHAGGRHAALTGRTVEITPDDVARYPGALEGVNMPIFCNGRVVAVIGVYGDPPATRDLAELAKSVAEHLIACERTDLGAGTQASLREDFFVAMTGHPGEEVPAQARQMALPLGFDLRTPRRILMAAIGTDTGGSQLPAEYRLPRLAAVRLPEIESMLRSEGALRRHDLLAPVDRQIAVVLAADDAEDDTETTVRRAEAIRHGLSTFLDLPVICGAGGRTSAGRLPISRRQAEFAARRCTSRRRTCSIHDKDVLLDHLRLFGTGSEGRIAARPFVVRLTRLFAERPNLRETLDALLRENLDCSATALRLGIHRNTLGYRLGRISEIGLSPAHRFDDALLAWFLLAVDAAAEESAPSS
jgi:carbohydrate diacid regulator